MSSLNFSKLCKSKLSKKINKCLSLRKVYFYVYTITIFRFTSIYFMNQNCFEIIKVSRTQKMFWELHIDKKYFWAKAPILDIPSIVLEANKAPPPYSSTGKTKCQLWCDLQTTNRNCQTVWYFRATKKRYKRFSPVQCFEFLYDKV